MILNFSVDIPDLDHEKKRVIKQAQTVLWKSMHKMLEIAKQKCPVDQGRLRNSIYLTPMTRLANEYILATGVSYAEDVEYGTMPHIIRPKNKKALAFEWTDIAGQMYSKKGRREYNASYGANKQGQIVFFREVHHPGTRPQPFFRPALLEVKTVWMPLFWKEIIG